jgi:hypothetical protein
MSVVQATVSLEGDDFPILGGLDVAATLGVLVEGHICVTRGSAGNTE